MERYVYNVGRYLTVRFLSQFEVGSSEYFRSLPSARLTSSIINKGRIYYESHLLAGQVAKDFESLCGRHSEEYRRSVWYLTSTLVEQQAWTQVQYYLEPLVRRSIDNPVLSWSHERCAIRLVDAFVNMGQQNDAQRVLKEVQDAYGKTGKLLRSARRNPLLVEQENPQVVETYPSNRPHNTSTSIFLS